MDDKTQFMYIVNKIEKDKTHCINWKTKHEFDSSSKFVQELEHNIPFF